jgi:hypothetical protein
MGVPASAPPRPPSGSDATSAAAAASAGAPAAAAGSADPSADPPAAEPDEIAAWLDEHGLGQIDGLLGRLREDCDDLSDLKEMEDDDIDEVAADLKLKLMKKKKIKKAIAKLVSGSEAFTPVTTPGDALQQQLAEPEWEETSEEEGPSDSAVDFTLTLKPAAGETDVVDSADSLSDRLEREVVRALKENSACGSRPIGKLFTCEPALVALWRETRAGTASLTALAWCEARPRLFKLHRFGCAGQFLVTLRLDAEQRIHVTNVNPKSTAEDLQQHFSRFGEVCLSTVHRRATEPPTATASVGFADAQSVLKAVACPRRLALDGCELTVTGCRSNTRKNKARTCVDCGRDFPSTFGGSHPRCTGCFGSGGKRAAELDDRELCNNYTEGRCKRGDDCRRRHDPPGIEQKAERKVKRELRRRACVQCRVPFETSFGGRDPACPECRGTPREGGGASGRSSPMAGGGNPSTRAKTHSGPTPPAAAGRKRARSLDDGMGDLMAAPPRAAEEA